MMGRISPEGHTVKMKTGSCAGPQRIQRPETLTDQWHYSRKVQGLKVENKYYETRNDFQHSFTCTLPVHSFGHFRLKTAEILIYNLHIIFTMLKAPCKKCCSVISFNSWSNSLLMCSNCSRI